VITGSVPGNPLLDRLEAPCRRVGVGGDSRPDSSSASPAPSVTTAWRSAAPGRDRATARRWEHDFGLTYRKVA